MLENILQGASGLKLRGGVVGKTSMVLMVTSVALASVAASSDQIWIDVLVVLAVAGLVVPCVHRLIGFADRNPHAALMEGAELLIHQEQQIRIKGGQPVVVTADSVGDETPSPAVTEPGTPQLDSATDEDLPDEVSSSPRGTDG